MTRKVGFLKLRFIVKKNSKKEKFILRIIRLEDYIKSTVVKLFSLDIFNTINRTRKIKINGLNFILKDTLLSSAARSIEEEMNKDDYHLDKIDFKPNDIVIDIGANIGIVSIYLARKYPFLKIYAFEPVKYNYNNFLENIKLNGINNGIIYPENKAITKDARNIKIEFNAFNSGGGGLTLKKSSRNVIEDIESATLDSVIDKLNTNSIKLLKIDCEGSEYEILYNMKQENLLKIQNICGEFHDNSDNKGDKLETYLKNYVKNINVVKILIEQYNYRI
jgi:FkbM family methyltransferase